VTGAGQPRRLGALTMDELAALVASDRPVAVLVPVGTIEPHGPHLPLETDNIISEACALRASELLAERGVHGLVAPGVAIGVTRYASAFAGAVSVDESALIAYLVSVVDGLLACGVDHVCLVNNHLEPEHDAAVRSAAAGANVSVATPLERRWARTLDDEFRSGACHAGSYETSIVMAARPDLVREDIRRGLAGNPVSLSERIAEGVRDFAAMGLERAYAGSPAAASASHGIAMIDRLAEMVCAEVCESLGLE